MRDICLSTVQARRQDTEKRDPPASLAKPVCQDVQHPSPQKALHEFTFSGQHSLWPCGQQRRQAGTYCSIAYLVLGQKPLLFHFLSGLELALLGFSLGFLLRQPEHQHQTSYGAWQTWSKTAASVSLFLPRQNPSNPSIVSIQQNVFFPLIMLHTRSSSLLMALNSSNL